jgi:hypothetical protein
MKPDQLPENKVVVEQEVKTKFLSPETADICKQINDAVRIGDFEKVKQLAGMAISVESKAKLVLDEELKKRQNVEKAKIGLVKNIEIFNEAYNRLVVGDMRLIFDPYLVNLKRLVDQQSSPDFKQSIILFSKDMDTFFSKLSRKDQIALGHLTVCLNLCIKELNGLPEEDVPWVDLKFVFLKN